MEVVDDVRVLKLINLIEDYHCSRPVILMEAVNEFVAGRRLAVDIDGGPEVIEDLVKRSEAG